MIPTAEDFLNVVKDHTMRILMDDGTHRHIMFKNDGDCHGWYEIVTWHGSLCIHGDYGTYTFSRLEDMFAFFRNKELKINPSYWAEKVVSLDREGIDKFSFEKYKSTIMENFDEFWLEGCGEEGVTRKEYEQEIEAELFNSDFCDGSPAAEAFAHDNVYNFHYKGYDIPDFWEYDLKEYTYRFIWNLYAIVWGIQQYDNTKEIR